MANDLITGTNTSVVPLSSQISVPHHPGPQVDLDTGTYAPIAESKADAQVMAQDGQLGKNQKYSPERSWNKATKDAFNELSPRHQKAWLDSCRIAEKYYNKLASELRTSYAILDDVAASLAPDVQTIIQQVGSPGEYIKNLIQADKEATQRPIDYILRIMAQRQITFDDLSAGIQPLVKKMDTEDAVAPVLNRISELENKLVQASAPQESEQFTQAEVDEMIDTITNYYAQTDSAGRPLYPNAEKMYDYIIDFLASGEAQNLDEAYKFAVESTGSSIPQSEFKNTFNPGAFNNSFEERSQSPSFPHNSLREKQMLNNVAEQIMQRYR
jgi:hypothetical protein